MTDIDLKRLAVDREYWDSVATSKATYAVHKHVVFAFVAKISGIMDQDLRFIPRPPKNAQEAGWDGEGLPPVGAEYCMTLGFVEYDRVKITYMGDGVFCYLNKRTKLEYAGALCDATFRPLKPKQNSLKEDLARVIKESDDLAYSFRPDDIADAVIKFYEERYNLEPKV